MLIDAHINLYPARIEAENKEKLNNYIRGNVHTLKLYHMSHVHTEKYGFGDKALDKDNKPRTARVVTSWKGNGVHFAILSK